MTTHMTYRPVARLPPAVSLDAMLAEAKCELAARRKYYPAHVAAGAMKRDIAAHKLNAMGAIVRTLQELRQHAPVAAIQQETA
jgi:hypothetical protein